MMTSKAIALCGLLGNFIGVVGIGFIVKYVQICGPYRGGLGKPVDTRHVVLNRFFWACIALGFVLQFIGVLVG